MDGVRVECASCQRAWRLPVHGSPYFLLDLVSRPCPYCESCALGCPEPFERPRRGAAQVFRRRRRPEPAGGR